MPKLDDRFGYCYEVLGKTFIDQYATKLRCKYGVWHCLSWIGFPFSPEGSINPI